MLSHTWGHCMNRYLRLLSISIQDGKLQLIVLLYIFYDTGDITNTPHWFTPHTNSTISLTKSIHVQIGLSPMHATCHIVVGGIQHVLSHSTTAASVVTRSLLYCVYRGIKVYRVWCAPLGYIYPHGRFYTASITHIVAKHSHMRYGNAHIGYRATPDPPCMHVVWICTYYIS
jgi:hypothetical protein